MATIVLRAIKGSPLTIEEADANFNNLNAEVGLKLNAADYTAADVLTKLKTVDGAGSGLDADFLDGMTSASTATASTIVARDSSGNFRANTITATSFVGSLTGTVIGDVVGTLTGVATNVSGVVAIENGGTGATTVAAARTNLGLGNMALQNAGSVNITGGSITGISPLSLAFGGTGATSATQARTNLGLVLGSDVQPFSNELTAIAGATTNGIYVRTGSGSVAQRTIVSGGNGIFVTNADGVAGNPSIGLATNVDVTLQSVNVNTLITPTIIKTGANGTGDIGQTGNRYGTIYGTATSAKYADLAEKYTTDNEYESGTVVVVSHEESGAEATASWLSGQRVLGVVSTNPAFLMNDEAPGQAIALRGRVPVKVVGPIRKGQPLISNQQGQGMFGDHQNSFAIALESNQDAGVKLVECVIL